MSPLLLRDYVEYWTPGITRILLYILDAKSLLCRVAIPKE
jgi:hypothetical protein